MPGRGIILLFLGLLLMPGLVAGQDANPVIVRRTLEQGHLALRTRDYARAEAVFAEALSLARARGDVGLQRTLAFNLGMTLQARSREEDAPELASRAEGYYREVLRLQPRSGAAYNNLAHLYAETGRPEEADAAYAQAVEQGGDRKAFFALNYGDFLARQGDPERALGYYQIAAREQPRNPAVQERLVAFFGRYDRDRLVAYLWELLAAGQARTATTYALAALAESPRRGGDEALRVELLALAVAGLSEQYYDPATFDEGPAGDAFRRLEADPVVGEGVREMRRMQREDPRELRPDDFRWWADRGGAAGEAPRGLWSREACQALLRSLGDWFRDHDDTARAAAYYRLAADLYGDSDPEAVLRLVDLYLRTDKSPDAIDTHLRDLLDRYVFRLFQGKGRAYRQAEWERIYAYHRTLGTIFALIEAWGSPREVSSAIFQLEHARRAAAAYREAYPDAEPLRFEARLVNLLARAYEATGAPERALHTRLDGALDLYQSGDPDGARQVLDALDEAGGLPPDAAERDVRRYNSLRRRLRGGK